MKKIIAENLEVERKNVSRAEAQALYEEIGDEYKLELLEAIPADEQVSIYYQGEFLIFAVVSTYHLLVNFVNSSFYH